MASNGEVDNVDDAPIQVTKGVCTHELPFYSPNTVFVTGWPDNVISSPEIYITFKGYGPIKKIRLYPTEALILFEETSSAVNAVQSVVTIKEFPVCCSLFLNHPSASNAIQDQMA